jgi:cold shock CspA family protein
MNKLPRVTGKVKFFKEDRNFGFIEADNGRELFLHQNQWAEDDLPAGGMRVSFIEDVGTKGPIARAVTYA